MSVPDPDMSSAVTMSKLQINTTGTSDPSQHPMFGFHCPLLVSCVSGPAVRRFTAFGLSFVRVWCVVVMRTAVRFTVDLGTLYGKFDIATAVRIWEQLLMHPDVTLNTDKDMATAPASPALLKFLEENNCSQIVELLTPTGKKITKRRFDGTHHFIIAFVDTTAWSPLL